MRFSKKVSKNVKVFGGINRRSFIPYAGVKHKNKGYSQSLTISPERKTAYTKTRIGKFNLKTKTDLDSSNTKINLSREKKKHY